ncbi:TonB-dependent receptor [Sphingomonas qomolangmaensis]|uniref:TonB-dependent receptor n=1 Tax=Sphingomonas qomolangmaensis TaxID=2918765 RepID=A0ABY5L9L2_9SPHN|nr:TonB-dependent receptor [Sphingomonas qomolangmaensis]UUL82489.1 TonB-dependent receptor [Sphingomonas qomolangmaensis]
MIAFATPAIAQDVQETPPADAEAEEIVVTGFRQSLENAVAAKKERDLVVESISAEDIGRLPDASIAESIARLPGLTSQRVSGRSNAISIRGFAPDFSTTLLNGREQTSTGDNRAVEYDQYPSEVVNQVLVYKTAQSNLIGQGLSGTVDLRSVIGGSKSYVTSTNLKRLGLQGTLQWQPAPNYTITLDGFFSDFDDPQIKRGIELPLAFDGDGPQATRPQLLNPVVDNNFVTGGTFTNVEGVVRNDSFERKAKLYSFGLNQKYEGDDGWNLFVDISYSKTDRSETIIESYAGTGYGLDTGASDTIGFQSGTSGTVFSPTLNYSDPNLILLTDPRGWGGANVQAGYFNDRQVRDEIQQYRGEVEKELEGFLRSIQFGLNYTRREKALTPDESLLVLTGGAFQQQIPSEYLLGSTNISYLGLGPMLSYNPAELLEGGVYDLIRNTSLDVPAKAFQINEDVMAAYLQANVDQEIGTAVLTGNFGVQFVSTVQKSSGLVAAGGALQPTVAGDDYIDVLPSVNLSLRLPSDWVFRVAAARQMQRARLDDMRVAINYGINTGVPGGIYQGSGGNPQLRPIRSNSYDATIEKYFGTRGYIALQGFYKDLQSFVYNLEQEFDFTSYPKPIGVQPATNIGLLNQPINGEGGNIYGVELAGTLPFGELSGALDGFGVTGGLSYTETQIQPTPGAPSEDIPGYSRWVANGTAFFEKWGFNARGSVRYRSTFIGELSGFGANRVRRRALDETIIDAQIGYDFQAGSALEGVSVFVQGQNLTDEPFVTVDPRDERAIVDFQQYGRRFLAGATVRF